MTLAIWGTETDVRNGTGITPQAHVNRPVIAALPNGGYVVGWREQTTTDSKLKFMIYNGLGQTTGVVHSVDAGGATKQNFLSIQAIGPDGSFAISWNATDASSGYDLKTRIFTAEGVGGEIDTTVDNTAGGETSVASLSSLTGGGYVSAYIENSKVVLRVSPTVGQSQVLTVDPSSSFTLSGPDVAQVASNKFVVTYKEGNNIKYKIITTGSSPQVPTDDVSLGAGTTAEVVALKNANGELDGRFAIVWQTGGVITARFYDGSGNAIGSTEITNNAYNDFTDHLSVTALRGGRIAVTFPGERSPGGDIVLKIADPTKLNQPPQHLLIDGAGNQLTPTITEMADGRLAIAWHDPTRNNRGIISSTIVDPREAPVEVNGTEKNDIYVGSEYGGDILRGLGGNDRLYGGNGDDTLSGGAGADVLAGGEGNDLATYESASAGVTASLVDSGRLNTGEAAGDSYSGIENLDGSAHADTLIGDAGANEIDGGNGSDTLYGGAGNDKLVAGFDGEYNRLIGGAGADTLDGAGGYTTVSYETATAGITLNLNPNGQKTGDAAGDQFIEIEDFAGSHYNDVLIGYATQGSNLFGNGGNDSIRGGTVADNLFGQAGDDILEGGAAGDKLDGGDGFNYASYEHAGGGVIASLAAPGGNSGDAAGDTYTSIQGLIGSDHGDTLTGRDGESNALYGRNNNDLLIGLSGNDTLDGGEGGDHLSGGEGFDFASYVTSSTGVTAVLRDIAQELVPAGFAAPVASGDATGDTYTDIEGLIGSHARDALYGNSANNTLQGNGGDDALQGGAGADLIYGDSGNDVLNGGLGADAMYGGIGNDIFYVDSYGDRVYEYGRGGTDTVYTAINFALSSTAEIERLTATGRSSVSLTGNAYANTITGNSGHNKIYGGLGNDQLKGGSGYDVFVFNTRPNKSTNVDKVLDFRAKDDSFHLDNKYFTKLGKGSSKGVRFKSDMFVEGKKAKDKEDRIVYDKGTGALYYDADGTGKGAQVKIATIANKIKLTHLDFFVI